MAAANPTHDLDMARIEALLRRLDPAESEACAVPGCTHLDHAAHDDVAVLRPAA